MTGPFRGLGDHAGAHGHDGHGEGVSVGGDDEDVHTGFCETTGIKPGAQTAGERTIRPCASSIIQHNAGKSRSFPRERPRTLSPLSSSVVMRLRRLHGCTCCEDRTYILVQPLPNVHACAAERKGCCPRNWRIMDDSHLHLTFPVFLRYSLTATFPFSNSSVLLL